VFLLFVPKTQSSTANILGNILLFHARLSAQLPQTAGPHGPVPNIPCLNERTLIVKPQNVM